MHFRIMTREELLKLYRNDQEICYRIVREEGFETLRSGIPYFNKDMFRYLGERINVRDDDTFKKNLYFKGFWWNKEWLIPIDPEIVDIDKDMALKLI